MNARLADGCGDRVTGSGMRMILRYRTDSYGHMQTSRTKWREAHR